MRTLLKLSLLKLLILITPNTFAGEFSVSPMMISVDSAPRKTETIEFEVKAQKAGKLRIFLSDLVQQETGHMGFINVTEGQDSMASWIDLDTDTLELAKDESAVVTGTVRIPKGAKGAHLAAIMVEEVRPPTKKGFGVKVRYAVMLDIKLKGRKTRLSSEFSDLAFEEQDGETVVVAWFENLADRDEFLQSEVQIRDERRRLVARMPLKTMSAWQRNDATSRVFSGSKVKVYGRLDKLISEGGYQVTVRNKFGGVALPRIKKDLVFATENIAEGLATVEWANYKVPAITAKPGPSGVAISQFELDNPYNQTIEIVFPKKTLSDTADASFHPRRIQLKPGQKTMVRLVQRWKDKTPQNEAYESELKSGSHSQSFQVVTVL